jgi:hypothetical protein
MVIGPPCPTCSGTSFAIISGADGDILGCVACAIRHISSSQQQLPECALCYNPASGIDAPLCVQCADQFRSDREEEAEEKWKSRPIDIDLLDKTELLQRLVDEAGAPLARADIDISGTFFDPARYDRISATSAREIINQIKKEIADSIVD